MEFKGKTFIASYSGGKDCMLAVHRAIRQGMKPMGLITTYNTDMERSWFHGIPEPILQEVSRSVGVPVVLIRTSGEAYRDNFVKELRRQKELGAEVCVFGDIDIEGHLEWCTDVCRDAGLEAYFPLWQESREALVRESIGEGFVANLTVVDTRRLTAGHLGKQLNLKLMESIKAEGADVCGENGEYHTFVSDGPIFAHPVPFKFGEKEQSGNYAVIPLLPVE